MKLLKNSVVLEDGEEIRVDAVIFCTGYNFEFPFIHESVRLDVTDNTVAPLYKQVQVTSSWGEMVGAGHPLRTPPEFFWGKNVFS